MFGKRVLQGQVWTGRAWTPELGHDSRKCDHFLDISVRKENTRMYEKSPCDVTACRGGEVSVTKEREYPSVVLAAITHRGSARPHSESVLAFEGGRPDPSISTHPSLLSAATVDKWPQQPFQYRRFNSSRKDHCKGIAA
ncbi:hypothetical protein AVEN_124664-1 [Araneus ventricosus]|uniref:Uncharacterized protein n=1 Tax=Araneus ventricosus TaxID=182803 RepID=A0A4Y2KIW6_ARAVE|nr:hypothetical protein AVEN_124664-1 [Araneus ventricosus]